MRDQKRIKKILNLIEDRWNEAPDMRFYQLMINMGLMKDDLQFWNLEDDKTLKYLEGFKW